MSPKLVALCEYGTVHSGTCAAASCGPNCTHATDFINCPTPDLCAVGAALPNPQVEQ